MLSLLLCKCTLASLNPKMILSISCLFLIHTNHHWAWCQGSSEEQHWKRALESEVVRLPGANLLFIGSEGVCFVFYWFERERKGERERGETSMWERNVNQLPPTSAPTGDWTLNLPSSIWDDTPTSQGGAYLSNAKEERSGSLFQAHSHIWSCFPSFYAFPIN